MDIGSRFSLEDFLAYFFPGVVGALGIYYLLLLLPFGPPLPAPTADLTTGIIFFVLSYITGVIGSGFSEVIFAYRRSSKDTILLHASLKNAVLDAFHDTFEIPVSAAGEWNREHYYLCRSMVYARVPGVQAHIQRQASLRQLRNNLLPSLVIWFAVGIVWGIQQLSDGATAQGIAGLVFSVALFIPILLNTINRAQSNEEREVREVLTAFVSGYRIKVEKDRDRSAHMEVFE